MKRRYKNGTLLTLDRDNLFYQNGFMDIENGIITGLGSAPASTEPWSGEEASIAEIDLAGKIVMPGMISSHCHFYGQFVRGLSLSSTISNWQQVLSRLWWKVDKALDEDMLYYSAMMGLVEGLKSGTTTYFDHQASPNAIDGCLDILESAVRKAGARASLCYEVTGRDGQERAMAGVKENLRFIRKHAGRKEDTQIAGMFGLHASYTLSQELLEYCAGFDEARQAGFHVHVAEDMADVSDCYKRFDKHPAERFHAAGILGPKSIAAHGVHLTPKEWGLLKETGTTLAHNSQSNLNNGVGFCPAAPMLEDGVAVALGGDGFTYDLFKELSSAILAQRGFYRKPDILGSNDIKALAFENNSRLAQQAFGLPLGRLEKGAGADFIILDYDPPTPLRKENIFSHLTSAFGGHVHTVVIKGNTVVENHRCTLFDEEEINARCRTHSRRLWDKLG